MHKLKNKADLQTIINMTMTGTSARPPETKSLSCQLTLKAHLSHCSSSLSPLAPGCQHPVFPDVDNDHLSSLLANWIREIKYWEWGSLNKQRKGKESDLEGAGSKAIKRLGTRDWLDGHFRANYPLVPLLQVHIPGRGTWWPSLGQVPSPWLEEGRASWQAVTPEHIWWKSSCKAKSECYYQKGKKGSRVDKNNKCPPHDYIASSDQWGRKKGDNKEIRRPWKLWFLIFPPYPTCLLWCWSWLWSLYLH